MSKNHKIKIVVVGCGYVGLSNAVLLAQNNEVIICDIVEEKINMINKKQSPIVDEYISKYLIEKDLNLKASFLEKSALENADFVIIATPTNYDDNTQYFNTESIESTLEFIDENNINATIVIKSTIPFGYTDNIRLKYNKNTILNCPEFLREGKALYDNLYPSRIVVGYSSHIITDYEKANEFANLMQEGTIEKASEILLVGHKEAECIKLFANTYLAMRVAFFNELDTFAYQNDLNVAHIIEGVSSDPRIGKKYNNPSFGYGGYCLPKDTKQLASNMKNTPNAIINSIPKSNDIRKEFIIDEINKKISKIEKKEFVIGFYRLIMKADSDNFRESSIIDIIKGVKEHNNKMIIYEPMYNEPLFLGIKVTNSLSEFKNVCDLIISNRFSKDLNDVRDKVFSRDIYEEN